MGLKCFALDSNANTFFRIRIQIPQDLETLFCIAFTLVLVCNALFVDA